MKINSTYTQTLTQEQILKAISFINKTIKQYFENKYNPTFIELPSFYYEESDLLLPLKDKTRQITFDFGDKYNTGVLPLHFANWRRRMVGKLNLSTDDAIVTEGCSIWRDTKTDTNRSIVRDELTYNIIADKDLDKNKILKNMTTEVVELIFDIANDLETMFGITNELNSHWPNIDHQLLENEMSELSTSEKEKAILEETSSFIFNNPGARTIQGKILKDESPLIYHLNQQNHLIVYDNVNFTSLNIANIAFYADGIILSDQIKSYALKSFEENLFYQNLIKNDSPLILEVKFNKSLLYSALLKIGHIGEVQPSAVSLEEKRIARKAKINFM